MDNPGGGPKFPLKGVNIILDKLDKKELLGCRLISQSWNQLCLEHLKKREYVQELSVDRVKEYADFVQKSQTTPVFPLKIRIGQIFTLPLAADVDFLIRCAGRNSVVELDLKVEAINDYNSMSICSLLEKLAPELLSLSLTESFSRTNWGDFLAKIRTLTFPKLKVLCLNAPWGTGTTEVFSVLIGRCPFLKVLDVSGPGPIPADDAIGPIQGGVNSRIRIPFETGLKNLKFRNFNEPNVLLQDIRNGSANQIALQSLTCEFCYLSLFKNWTLLQCQAMREIMEELSPKMQSFSYSIQSFYQHLMTSSFPVLTTLNLYLSNPETGLDFTGFANPIPSSLSQVLLPSLKRVGFPIGIYWNAPDDLPVIGSVLELTFQAHKWQSYTMQDPYISASDIQNCLVNAFRAFPNATRLTLRESRTDLALRKLLLGLVQFPNAEVICELTVEDYREDYIGKNFLQLANPPVINIVLDKRSLPEMMDEYMLNTISGYFDKCGNIDLKTTEDSDSVRIETIATPQLLESSFTNVFKLTLLVPPNDSNDSWALDLPLDLDATPPTPPQRILYLDHMAKCFPNLRILEMSAGLLEAVEANPLPGWERELARKIESMYSDWTVQLTGTAPPGGGNGLKIEQL